MQFIMYGVRLDMMFEGTPRDNLNQIWSDLQDYYRAFHPAARLEGLKLSSFSDSINWKKRTPQLKSKANIIRHTGEALLNIWQKYMDPSIIQHKQIELLLQRSVRVEELLTQFKDSDRLIGEAAIEFEKAGLEYLVLMNSLNSHYVESEQLPLFAVTGKCHYLAHCLINAKFLSPRRTWCYLGEDVSASYLKNYMQSLKPSPPNKKKESRLCFAK